MITRAGARAGPGNTHKIKNKIKNSEREINYD